MRGPVIAPGHVEQAIYTWSKHNLTNGKGQGITEVSPGLRNAISWLGSLDLHRFRAFPEGTMSESDGYEGWKDLVTVGALPVGDLTVVYRKISSAGKDGVGRNRFVTHMLVANANEVDLSSIAADDPRWLTAEECPLDKPPKLDTLKIDELTPRRAAHACPNFDSGARELFERVTASPGELRQAGKAKPLELTSALLAAIPTALWPRIDLTWWVGDEGPVYRFVLVEEGARLDFDTADRVRRAGLLGCTLHSFVDEIWAGLGPGDRTWEGFAAAFVAPRGSVSKPTDATRVTDRAVPSADGFSPRRQLAAAIAAAIGAQSWDEVRLLTDRQVSPALGAIESLPQPHRGWLATLTPGELRAIFAGIENRSGFGRALRFLAATGETDEALAQAWNETGVAAFGLALLNTDQPGNWAVPREVDAAQLEKLVMYLLGSDRGLDQIGLLLREGFAATQEARRSIIEALVAAKATPRSIFTNVLPRAELPPADLFEFVREYPEMFGEGFKILPEFVDAISQGLPSRRRFSWWIPFLKGVDGGGDQPVSV